MERRRECREQRESNRRVGLERYQGRRAERLGLAQEKSRRLSRCATTLIRIMHYSFLNRWARRLALVLVVAPERPEKPITDLALVPCDKYLSTLAGRQFLRDDRYEAMAFARSWLAAHPG